ncbi:3-coathanger stack domain-containing protein [Emticicia sp. BO119]|uniref:3-coathanger stack domain-containing protein n=1 Tax=Emticicia sp. BO119 TaxID=2757768 RepID=UPI0015F0E588|nr:3-coathanger stack domain-containing protein [Emticicia sp. BO119]MBA4851471.1 hypothetical protein [Emticicia sp. BO119]
MKKELTLMLLFFSYQLVAQRNIYVDATSGNDAGNDGLTLNTPFKTIQKAFMVMIDKDIINIRGGVYSATNLNIVRSGTALNYLTLKNYQNETVIIDGGAATSQKMLNITSQSYIKIVGVHFRNSKGRNAYGLNIDGSSHHIEIRDCKISDIKTNELVENISRCNLINALPLKVCGSSPTAITDIIIDGNEIFDCQTGCSEGLSVSGNVNGFLISNNSVHDISNIGIVAAGQYANFCPGVAQNGIIRANVVYNCVFPELSVNSSASGIYIDGGHNIIAEQNRVFRCQVGMQLGCENEGKTASNDTLRNNLVYDNEKWGIGVGGDIGFVENSAVLNNTLFKNNRYFDGTYYGNFGELLLQKVRNSSIMNNLCFVRYQASNAVFMKWTNPVDLTNMTINYNLYYNDNGVNSLILVKHIGGSDNVFSYNHYLSLGYDSNAVTTDPQLLNPVFPQPELHLKSNSPALNAGWVSIDNKAGNNDFDGNTRKSSTIDIGAYESQPCPFSYRLYGTPPDGLTQFKSSQNIYSISSIPNTTGVSYQSVNKIELMPGFQVANGAVFSADLSGCN